MKQPPIDFILRCALLLLMLFFGFGAKHSHAQSSYTELPREMKILDAFEGTYIFVLNEIHHDGYVILRFYEKRNNGLFSVFPKDRKAICEKGNEIKVDGTWYDTINHSIQINLGGECRISFIYIEAKDGDTVGKFNDNYRGFLKIVYRDPYKDFPDDVATDLVMEKITSAIKSQSYSKALYSFRYLENRIEKLPESFWYFYIETASNNNDKEKVRALGTKYIRDYGKNGKYYGKVIALMAK